VFAQPTYQADAVSAYFKSGVQLPPATQYHQSGRGSVLPLAGRWVCVAHLPRSVCSYPDVGTLGHNYNVYIAGQDSLGSGTSASAPVFAAMISLVNDARLNQGKPSVGFVNPALYQIAEQVRTACPRPTVTAAWLTRRRARSATSRLVRTTARRATSARPRAAGTASTRQPAGTR
jgi:hypothetical protein